MTEIISGDRLVELVKSLDLEYPRTVSLAEFLGREPTPGEIEALRLLKESERD